jgi:Ca2+/Na+ antiporter
LAAMSASLIAVLVLGLQVLGASPFVLQRMIIRLSQPWLLALITLACTNISRRPEYVVAFVVILLIVVYFVAVRKSNKVVAEEAVVIPEVDIDDDDKELSNTHSAKSLHSGAEVAVGGVDAIRSEYSHSSHDDENDDEADHFDHNLLGSTDADGEDVPIDLPMGDFDEEVKVGSSFHIPLDHRNSSNSRKEARDNWSDASRSSKTHSDDAVARASDRSYYSRNGKDSRSGSGSRSRSHNDSSSFTSSYNISQKESSISLSEEEPDVNKINGPNRAGGSRRSSSRDDRQSASRSASASASSESAYGIVGPRARSESHTDSDSDSDSENSKESDHPVFHYKDHAHDSSRGHSESGQSSSSGSSTGDSDIESVHSEVVGPRGTY